VDFHFNEEQLMFRDSVRALLERDCTADVLRELWAGESGRSDGLWSGLAELGLTGLLLAEEHGGLGMAEVDLVLALEESGRACLPEPLVETVLAAAPLLETLAAGGGTPASVADKWLPLVAAGEARLAIEHPANPCVADAHVAELLLLLAADGSLHAVERAQVELIRQPCNDAARRLFTVDWKPGDDSLLAKAAGATRLLDAAFDRAAFGCAAQQLGIGQKLIDLAVDYAGQREQFGRAIGSFQAVKHHLATAQVAVEFARPVVYRAACSLATGHTDAGLHVSQAKAMADEAALLAARTSLQVHGGIGYTWEVDLHAWMKRAWALEMTWGGSAWHRGRLADAVLADIDNKPREGQLQLQGVN